MTSDINFFVLNSWFVYLKTEMNSKWKQSLFWISTPCLNFETLFWISKLFFDSWNFVLILVTFEMESLNYLIWNYFLNKIIIYLTDCVYPPLGFLKALVMAKEMSKVINTLEIIQLHARSVCSLLDFISYKGQIWIAIFLKMLQW